MKDQKGEGEGFFIVLKFMLAAFIFVVIIFIAMSVSDISLDTLASPLQGNLVQREVSVEIAACLRGANGNCTSSQYVVLNDTMHNIFYLKVCAKRGLDGNTDAVCNGGFPIDESNACDLRLYTYDQRITYQDPVVTGVTADGVWYCKEWEKGDPSFIDYVKAEIVSVTAQDCDTPNPKCVWVTEMNATIGGYVSG